MKGKGLHMVTWILVMIGGLNWLVFGLFGWDIGQVLGGMGSGLSRLIYILVGVSAVVEIITHKKTCKMCGDKGGMSQPGGAM